MIVPGYTINTKKLYLLICMALIILVSSSYTYAKDSIAQIKSHKSTVYFGQLKNTPKTKFCVFYDGEFINLQDDTFSIKDQLISIINLLFVDPEKIQISTEDNTVQKLSVDTKDYKYYQLEVTHFTAPSDLKNSYSYSWKILEKPMDHQTIPLNTIVVPLSPSLIDIDLQNISGKPSNLVIKLPIIKLSSKNNRTLESLMQESYLKTISLKPFFAKQRIKSFSHNNIKISLIIWKN